MTWIVGSISKTRSWGLTIALQDLDLYQLLIY